MNAASPVAARRVRVSAIRDLATDIRLFELAPADGRPLAPFTAGAHVDVHIPAGPVRQYSLCGDPGQPGPYIIAVKREAESRGGSAAMHRSVEVGSIMGISVPKNNFPLACDAARHVFVAGGIGITPIRSMIREVAREGGEWELHYCARSRAHAAFYDELKGLEPVRVHEYFSEEPLLNVAELSRQPQQGTHLYCCGPTGLMSAVKTATAHWPKGHVHFEWFKNALNNLPPPQAFEVELRRSGLVVTVPPDRSILQVLRDQGLALPSSCEEGVCGTCETVVLAGEPDHHDVLLSPEERASNKTMMICISRAKGGRLVLDI